MNTFAITTKRLKIRSLSLSDLADFHVYRSNPEVLKYQGSDVMTLPQAEKFIIDNSTKQFGTAGQWVQFGIEHKETKRLIGDCAIRFDHYDPRIAEVGMTISHLEQQRGYAKESLLGILGFLFDTKNIHRVVEIVDAENTASINLLKSIGFRKEGHFIENIFFKGKWGSEFQYAMLKREWEEKNRNK